MTKTFITLIATILLGFSAVSVAQDEGPMAGTVAGARDAEAQGSAQREEFRALDKEQAREALGLTQAETA